MSETHTITIKDGAVTVAVSGVKGKSCVKSTADLESKLGTVQSDTKTGEYYEQPLAQNLNQ